MCIIYWPTKSIYHEHPVNGYETCSRTKKRLLITLTLVIIKLGIASSHSSFPITQDTDDFQTLLLNNDLYVDKSLLIEEFLDHMDNYTVPVVLRPEGWGKSTNADMLRKFFEIEVDTFGERLPKENRTNHKLFLGGDIIINSNNDVKTLKPLKISNSLKSLQYLGNCPVIMVKMKNAIGSSFEETENNVKLCVSEAFKSHDYLLHSSRITDKEKFSNYSNGIMNTTDLTFSIVFLSQKLHEHFSTKVHIIIDDYDIPMIHAHLTFSQNLRQMNELELSIRRIYDVALKNNPCRSVGLVSGVIPPVKSRVFVLDLINVHHLMRKKPPFFDYYGLTRPEVEDILTKVPIKLDPGQISSWYGGYSVFGPRDFYNTRSVIRCLTHNGTLQYYGSDSKITTLVDEFLLSDDRQQVIQKLISREFVSNFYYSFGDATAVHWGAALLLFRIVYLAGYVTADITDPCQSTTIPNEEIKYYLETKVLQWVSKKFCVDSIRFRSFVGQIVQGQIYPFRQTLKKYLKIANNFYPLNKKSSKVFYGAFKIAIRNALSATHSKLSPEQQITKTNDTILIPRQGKNDAAVVIAYQVIDREENLESVAKAGLYEMYTRQYGEQLKTYSHIQKIMQVSMSFCKEKFHLQCSVEKL